MVDPSPIITKYRPTKFADVIGQSTAVAALTKVIERRDSQAFLFVGPSGVGKTTLARIAARAMGCQDTDLLEIPAAVKNGVDDMREVLELLRYRSFSQGEVKAIIMDECQRLGRPAWEVILKGVEEPPKHVVWFFCTTEPEKVIPAIKTRCTTFTLKLVPDNLLREMVVKVARKEKVEISDSILDLIVREARGSPRQALSNFAICRDTPDKRSAAELLKTALESDPTHALCQLLVQGGSWARAMDIFGKLESENPEGIRIVVCHYITAALKASKVDDKAGRLLEILDNFSFEYRQSDGHAPLLLAIGQTLLGR